MTAAVGKAMRLKRVIDPKGVSVICALDHGMTSPSFLEPLSDIAARTAEAVRGGANVIMMSKGMIRVAEPAFSPTTSLALLLSASANPEGTQPAVVQVAEVEEAATGRGPRWCRSPRWRRRRGWAPTRWCCSPPSAEAASLA